MLKGTAGIGASHTVTPHWISKWTDGWVDGP